MTTLDQPITRTDLREEFDRVLAHYATKEDLAQLETRLTKQMGELRNDLKGTLIQPLSVWPVYS